MMTANVDPLALAVAAYPAALPVVLVLLKVTGLLLAASLAARVLQRASAGSRHLVWLTALAALLLVPPLAVWGPLPIRILPETLSPAASPAAEPIAFAPQPSGRLIGEPPGAGIVQPSGPSPVETPNVLAEWTRRAAASPILLLWAFGALVLLARLGLGAWSVRRIVRRSKPLDHPDWQTPLYEIADRLGLERAPRLLRSEDVKMPFAAGLLTATIVLPAESDGWTAERRIAVLIHELGHVRRRDLIGHTLGRIACAVYWFHPLVWTAARRLRAESERACDDLALAFGARPSDYAEHLLEIVTSVRNHYTPAVALAMAHRKEFEGRMLAILNPELRRRGPSRAETAGLVGSLAVLALLMGAAAPVPRTAPPSPLAGPREPPAHSVTLDTVHRDRVAPDTIRRALVRRSPPMAPAAIPAAVRTALDTSSARGPGDDRATALAKTLRTDSSASVRRVAAWGLQRYARLPVAADALIAALDGDRDPEVREMAAWALADTRGGSAGAVLGKAVRQDKDPHVRETAVWALGTVRDPGQVPALVGALGNTDAEVREIAAWAIGSNRPEQAPSELVRALGDHERDVRLSVAWALYVIRDTMTVGALDAAFRREPDPEVQRGLLRALGAMGDRAVDALSKLVGSPDSEVRTVAVTALAGGDASGPWPWPRPRPRPFP